MRILDAHGRDAVLGRPAPDHVGLIIDGNRRWALARGIPPEDAHLHGAAAMCSVLATAADIGLPALTLFCLSVDNLRRPAPQVDRLGDLDSWLWTPPVVAQLQRSGLDVRVVGDLGHPALRTTAIEHLRHRPRTPGAGLVTFIVNSSGRRDLEIAARGPLPLAQQMAQHPLPDFDLVVRPGGQQRLSDFALWQAAHAELVFTDTLWPDFTGLHLLSAIAEHHDRRRTRGR